MAIAVTYDLSKACNIITNLPTDLSILDDGALDEDITRARRPLRPVSRNTTSRDTLVFLV